MRAENLCTLRVARGSTEEPDETQGFQLDQISKMDVLEHKYNSEMFPRYLMRVYYQGGPAHFGALHLSSDTKSDASAAEMRNAAAEVQQFLKDKQPAVTTKWTLHATITSTLNDLFLTCLGALVAFMSYGFFRTEPSKG